MSTRTDTIAHELAASLAARLGPELGAEIRIGAETDLSRDLGLESIQVMEFVEEIEDHYDVSIALERLSKARTVRDLAAIVAVELGHSA